MDSKTPTQTTHTADAPNAEIHVIWPDATGDKVCEIPGHVARDLLDLGPMIQPIFRLSDAIGDVIWAMPEWAIEPLFRTVFRHITDLVKR